MPQDLTTMVRELSPGALRLFKQQLASLSPKDRQVAYQRLQNVPELSDIIGRPPQEDVIGKLPAQPEQTQPTMKDIPLWQKGLQAIGKPFQEISEHITEPFGAYVTSPFTPALAGTEGMGWAERERAEYAGWKEPEFTMPWGGKFKPTKGIVETLPWLALPSAGTIASRLGVMAKGAGGLARGAAIAEKIVKPIAAVEAIPGKIVGKVAGKVLPKKVIEIEREAIKTYGVIDKLSKYQGSYILEDGRLLDLDDAGHRMLGMNDFGRQTGGLRLRVTPTEINVDFINTRKPTLPQLSRIKNLSIDKKITYGIVNEADNDLLGEVGTTFEKMSVEVNQFYSKPLAGIPPVKPPVPPTITSELFPEGFKPEQQTAIKWLTDLVKTSKPLTKETLALRVPEHAARGAEYERVLQSKISKGIDVGQAAEEAASEALKGKYSVAPLTPAFQEGLKEQGKYGATLLRTIADADFGKFTLQKKNAFDAFWSLLKEGHLQMNQIETLEKVFGSDFAKALLGKHRTLGQKIWFNVVDLLNVPRGLLSMADMSGFGRQGWILTTTRPSKAVEAFVPMIRSMLDPKEATFMDGVFLARPHIDKVLKLRPDFLTKWAGEATDIVAREEGFASRWLNKLPVVGAVYRGSTRAYTTVLNDLRTANVSAAISGWEKKGYKYLLPKEAEKMFSNNAKAIFDASFYTDFDIDLIARTVSWASGRGSLPKELAKHAGVANAIFFAPKLIASTVEFPLAVLPFVTPSRLARQEAVRELISFIGTGAGILGMAKLAGVGDVELDMRSPDFGKLKVEDTRLDIWRGYTQYLRFIAQMATAQGKTESGRITAKDRGNLIWRFTQSKLSPAAGFINDWVSGETYLGEDMPPKSAKRVLGQIYQRSMPLAIQDLVDGYLEDSWSGGIIASAGFFGVGIVTYTDETKRARDKVAQKQYGMTWDEVGRQYGRAEQLKLEQTTPAILEAEKEQEKRFATGTPTTMSQWQSEGQSVEETYRETINLASKEFRATGDGATFRDKVDSASSYRRQAYSSRAKRKEYQDIVAYYNQPIPPDKVAQMNPGDVLRREYYQTMFGLDMYDQFGNYLFEEAERREQKFLTKNGQQALDYIEDYSAARWVDKPPELQMLEQARDLLRPYWQIEDNIWNMYPPELKVVSDQIKIMERTDPERARQFLKSYPAILRARELVATYKKQMRQYNPAIQTAYKLFYG